ncbi:BolA family transcriptional regulator [Candidatus Bodocaedibacter vickermanii]|uniref:BolA family transcriptional regulator n=1 Tax=Candidatus Bodocaedibacter vickermanii TaxID=2741701 RepID=A0A7L9RUI4_9PROT|nr:BolA family transcriptional regulator [Candidatus Paracaedibacteraceae bacterium 'Lake Konstanz']
MAVAQDKLYSLLKESFADAEVIIQDLAGDGDHYAVTVKSPAFKGMTRVQQHKMVYDALQGAMAAELHALAIKTEVL